MKLQTRREQIISEAIELMASGGIQNVTIKNLAAAIGVSEPALYRHFENKQAILLGILDTFEAATSKVLRNLNRQAPALEQLQYFVFDRYAQFQAYPSLAQLMFAEAAFEFDSRLSTRLLQIMHRHRDMLLQVIQEGQARHEIREDIAGKELFRIVIGATRLIIQQWILSDFRFDLSAEGKLLWQALETLLKKTEGEAPYEATNHTH